MAREGYRADTFVKHILGQVRITGKCSSSLALFASFERKGANKERTILL